MFLDTLTLKKFKNAIGIVMMKYSKCQIVIIIIIIKYAKYSIKNFWLNRTNSVYFVPLENKENEILLFGK